MSQTRITNVIEMLAKAIDEAGTATDVVAVAEALEGMEFDSMWGGSLYMRPEDHQLIQEIYAITALPADEVKNDYDIFTTSEPLPGADEPLETLAKSVTGGTCTL